VGVGDQPPQRLQALGLGGLGVAQDHRRGGVVDPGGVPAVTEPFLSNTGLSLAMPSSEASARMCSSVSKVTVPLRDLSSMGRICSLK
jgi:hypothetical protein